MLLMARPKPVCANQVATKVPFKSSAGIIVTPATLATALEIAVLKELSDICKRYNHRTHNK
jgi:hypothetical protein